jgi:hypothetical protein
MHRTLGTSLNTRRLPRLALALAAAALLAEAAPALAQSRQELDAASQALDSDPDLAAWDLALTTNLLGPLFGSYGARVEVAPTRWLSLAASPAWLVTAGGSGVALDLAAHLWPLGAGLDGAFVGPSLTAARLDGNGAPDFTLGASCEAGWQAVWSGLAVSVSAEVGWAVRAGDASSSPWVGVRVGLGWAWR